MYTHVTECPKEQILTVSKNHLPKLRGPALSKSVINYKKTVCAIKNKFKSCRDTWNWMALGIDSENV